MYSCIGRSTSFAAAGAAARWRARAAAGRGTRTRGADPRLAPHDSSQKKLLPGRGALQRALSACFATAGTAQRGTGGGKRFAICEEHLMAFIANLSGSAKLSQFKSIAS